MTFISKYISIVILLLSGCTQLYANTNHASVDGTEKISHTSEEAQIAADNLFAVISRGVSDVNINDKTEITESEEQEEHLHFQYKDVTYHHFLGASLFIQLPKLNYNIGYLKHPLYHHTSNFFSHQVLYISFCVYRL